MMMPKTLFFLEFWSGSGPGPSVAAAPRRGTASLYGPPGGPDLGLGPDPGPGPNLSRPKSRNAKYVFPFWGPSYPGFPKQNPGFPKQNPGNSKQSTRSPTPLIKKGKVTPE